MSKKISKEDLTLASRFRTKKMASNNSGFGTTQSEAKLSKEQINRLLRNNLIELTYKSICLSENKEWGQRNHFYYCQTDLTESLLK